MISEEDCDEGEEEDIEVPKVFIAVVLLFCFYCLLCRHWVIYLNRLLGRYFWIPGVRWIPCGRCFMSQF